MRKINLIVIHCSATREDRTLTAFDLNLLHRRRGFNGTGYHYYIRKDGTVFLTRPVERIGAHARGFNENSIGICYEGGLDWPGTPGGYTNTGTTHITAFAGEAIARTVPRLQGVRTPGSESGPQWEWGN